MSLQEILATVNSVLTTGQALLQRYDSISSSTASSPIFAEPHAPSSADISECFKKHNDSLASLRQAAALLSSPEARTAAKIGEKVCLSHCC